MEYGAEETTPQNQNESQKSICCPSGTFLGWVDPGWPARPLGRLAFDDEKTETGAAKASKFLSKWQALHLTAPRSNQRAEPLLLRDLSPVYPCPRSPFK